MMVKSVPKNWSFLEVSLGLLFALPLFPRVLRTIIVVIFGITIIYLGITKRKRFNFSNFLNGAFPYFLILMTLFLSDNLDYGVNKIQTMSPLFIFPLLFSWLDQKDILQILTNMKTYLWVFIISVFLFNLLPFLWFWITNYEFFEAVKHFPEVIVVDIGQYSITPIYMSTLIALAILFCGKLFLNSEGIKDRIVLLFLNIILFLFLVLYARKGVILGLFLVLAIWLFFFQQNFKTTYKIAILVGVTFLILAFPQTRKRFGEMFQINENEGFVSETVSIRLITFDSAIELIKKSPIIGYGIGDYNDILDKNNRKISTELKVTYNSHNQYLSLILIGGIILLTSFALFIGNIFRYALIHNNIILILLLIFYAVLLFVENILERENGVLYFSLFVNLFSLLNRHIVQNENNL